MHTFEEFDRALSSAREEVAKMAAAEPEDGAIRSVKLQLEALPHTRRDEGAVRYRTAYGGIATHAFNSRVRGNAPRRNA
jgi:hypothetical protein